MRLARLAAPLSSAALVLAAASVSRPARAQSDTDRATARALGEDGETALAAKDYKKAEDDFRRADSLIHAPTLMLGLARALAGEGKVLGAQEAYKRILREGVAPGAPEPFKRALEAAKQEVGAVEPRIGGMIITVRALGGGDVPSAKVTVDDQPVNTALLGVRRLSDPGVHVVRATADGYRAAEIRVTVPEGGNVDAPVSLVKEAGAAPPAQAPAGAPVAVPPAPGQPAPAADQSAPAQPTAAEQASSSGAAHKKSILPWVAFGFGGLGLAAGTVTGVMALGKHSDLANACPGGKCTSDQQGNLDSYHTLGMVSTVGFIVAGVGAAAGVTLLVLGHKSHAESAPAAALVVGPGTIGAAGSF